MAKRNGVRMWRIGRGRRVKKFNPNKLTTNYIEFCKEEIISQSDESILQFLRAAERQYDYEVQCINHYLNAYFKMCRKTQSRVNASMVDRMTTYQKVGVLEEIDERTNDKLPSKFINDLHAFVSKLDRDKYRSIDDVISNGKIRVMCECGKDFFVLIGNNCLPRHVNDDGEICMQSGFAGICEIAFNQ